MVQSERVLKGAHAVAFAILGAAAVYAAARYAAYWVALDAWATHPVLMALVTLIQLAFVGFQQTGWWLLLRMRRPVSLEAQPGTRVGVCVTFVPAAESLEMLEETVQGLVAMSYPHETWVLDEDDEPRVEQLCARLGAKHFSRRNRPELCTRTGKFAERTKYGNVNAWLEEIAYGRFDVVASFDPDHRPEPRFLERTLGQFADPAVGYVQAAQVYYNQGASFVARGAAEETYHYYSSLQMSSFGMGLPAVIGCHNVHRVEALREVGGFAAHDADDLMIALHYRAALWRGVYVPEALAWGLTPVDMHTYLRQQLRWARSVIDIKMRRLPRLARSMTGTTRLISLLHGLGFAFGALPVLLAIGVLVYLLLTGAYSLVSVMLAPQGVVLAVVLIGLELYRQCWFLEPETERGIHWRALLLRIAKWPQMLQALGEVLLDRRVPYSITCKSTVAGKRPLILWPQLLLGLGVAAAWAIGIVRGVPIEPGLHVCAGLTIVSTFVVWVSQFRRFPAAYDRQLQERFEARRATTRGSACGLSADSI